MVVEGRAQVQEDGSFLATQIRAEKVTPPTPPGPGPTPSPKATDFAGTVTVVGGACPAGVFTIAGVVVHATAETHYPSASCAEVVVGSEISGRGIVQEDGSVVASQVHVRQHPAPAPNPSPNPPGKETTLKGAASAVGGACPALGFTVAGQVVQTNADTKFIGSGQCSLIVNGKDVEVTGTLSPAAVLIATRVKVQK